MPPSGRPRCRRCTAVATASRPSPERLLGGTNPGPSAGPALDAWPTPGSPSAGASSPPATGPHWARPPRPLQVLLRWGEGRRRSAGDIDERSPALHGGARVQGVRAYLWWRGPAFRPRPAATGHRTRTSAVPLGLGPGGACRTLERMGEAGKRQALGVIRSCSGTRTNGAGAGRGATLGPASAPGTRPWKSSTSPRTGAGEAVARLFSRWTSTAPRRPPG